MKIIVKNYDTGMSHARVGVCVVYKKIVSIWWSCWNIQTYGGLKKIRIKIVVTKGTE